MFLVLFILQDIYIYVFYIERYINILCGYEYLNNYFLKQYFKSMFLFENR